MVTTIEITDVLPQRRRRGSMLLSIIRSSLNRGSHLEVRPPRPSEYQEMYRLRHDRYVREGIIESQEDGLDVDEYDLEQGRCFYLVAIQVNGSDQKMVGSMRLVCPREDRQFPVETYFEWLNYPDGYFKSSTREFSRFVRKSGESGPIGEALVLGAYRYMRREGVRHIIGVALPKLFHRLEKQFSAKELEGELCYQGTYYEHYFANEGAPVAFHILVSQNRWAMVLVRLALLFSVKLKF